MIDAILKDGFQRLHFRDCFNRCLDRIQQSAIIHVAGMRALLVAIANRGPVRGLQIVGVVVFQGGTQLRESNAGNTG